MCLHLYVACAIEITEDDVDNNSTEMLLSQKAWSTVFYHTLLFVLQKSYSVYQVHMPCSFMLHKLFINALWKRLTE